MDTVRILVIEDDGAVARNAESAVVGAGYGVAGVAASIDEGVRMTRAQSADLVLLANAPASGISSGDHRASVSELFDVPVILLGGEKPDLADPFTWLGTPLDGRELRAAVEVCLYKHTVDRELRAARQAAEAADKAKTSFLSTISHELRTPMNGVLGMAELLLLSDLDEPYRENVVLIKDSALSLLSVLNQIIDYSKLETSSMKIREIDFRFEDLITGVLSQYRRSASAKGLKLGYTIDPDIPVWLLGDSAKIRQVLGNLVNNAVKFTPSGQVMVDVSLARGGECASDEDCLAVQVLVQDTGMGIETEQIETIFDSFSLVEDHLCHGSGGLGLGLAIVNRLLVLLGEYSLHQQQGQGQYLFRRHPPEAEPVRGGFPLAEVMEGGRPLEGARVLVAEDDLVNQRYITRLLEKMGCFVLLVEDGKQAVETLVDAVFDIVLMDVEMPVMDGIEATRAIRRPETGCLDPDIPIVALTAHAMWGDEQRCMHAGMTDYVPKPVDMDTVAAIIRSTLDAR